MTERIARAIVGLSVPAWLAFFGVEAFVGHLPLWICWLALLLVEGGLGVTSIVRGGFHPGHAGAALALAGFGAAAVVLGFDSVFPSTGAFFYAGYGVAFVLQGTWFRESSYRIEAMPWFLLIGALYASGCAISLLLAPNVAYLYLPPLLAVLPSLLISIRVGRKYGIEESKASRSDEPFVGPRLAWLLVLVLVGVAASLPWIIYKKDGGRELTAKESHALDSLEALPKPSLDADAWLALGRLRFLSGKTEQSRECFEKVRAVRPADPLASAYIASLVAIQARDEVNPIQRVRWANEAATVLDSLVRARPEHEELRLIRAKVYVEYPASFHKTDSVRKDVAILMGSADASEAEAARSIQSRITSSR